MADPGATGWTRPTPVNSRINEMKAGSVAGDMSALSPTTLEMERDQRTTPGKRSGRTPRRESSGKRPFDFANVSVGSERRNGPRREDPPESSDASYAESFTQRLMDPPTGPIDADHYLEEEERDDNEEDEVAGPISCLLRPTIPRLLAISLTKTTTTNSELKKSRPRVQQRRVPSVRHQSMM
jgi:hypothetical protein